MSCADCTARQCHSIGHNGHERNLYGRLMSFMGYLYVGGHFVRGTLSPSTPV